MFIDRKHNETYNNKVRLKIVKMLAGFANNSVYVYNFWRHQSVSRTQTKITAAHNYLLGRPRIGYVNIQRAYTVYL